MDLQNDNWTDPGEGAEARLADLEHELLQALREMHGNAGVQYTNALNRGLLAVCGMVLWSELALKKIEDDYQKIASTIIACIFMLLFVFTGRATSTKAALNQEQYQKLAETCDVGGNVKTMPLNTAHDRRTTAGQSSQQRIVSQQNLGTAQCQANSWHTDVCREPSSRSTNGAPRVLPSTVDGWVIKTKAELSAVNELRERLTDLVDQCTTRPLDMSDCVLIRFVRARKTLDESEKMYRAAAKWRKETHPEQIIETYSPSHTFRRWVPGGYCMWDRDGTPLFIDRIGSIDVPTCMARIEESEFVNYSIFKEEYFERLCIESERRMGKQQYQATLIVDVANLSMRHWHTVGFHVFKSCVFIHDHYYPERLKVAHVINAPKIFSILWKVVKTFLDPNTRSKVRIYGHTPTEDLLKQVPSENLPKCYGGDLVIDGDPECSSILGRGGIIPNDYIDAEDNEIGEGHLIRSLKRIVD